MSLHVNVTNLEIKVPHGTSHGQSSLNTRVTDSFVT